MMCRARASDCSGKPSRLGWLVAESTVVLFAFEKGKQNHAPQKLLKYFCQMLMIGIGLTQVAMTAAFDEKKLIVGGE